MTDRAMTDPAGPDGSLERLQSLLWDVGGKQRLLLYFWAACFVASGTLVAEFLYRVFDMTRLSMVFLAAVLLAALHLGRGPAVFSAIAAFFIYNFYLVEPRFTVQFATADDFLTLILFLAVALGTGGLAGRVHDEVVQRRARERTLSTLFNASRLMSATENEGVLRDRIAEAVATAAQGWAATVDDHGAPHPFGVAEDPLEWARVAQELAVTVQQNDERGALRAGLWRARQLRADGQSMGVVVWRAASGDLRTTESESLINVLVDLGAAALARARLSRANAEMEAVTQAEQLRTALLSSISHDFRTPLAVILASATSVLEYDDKLAPAVRQDLLRSIQEEVERLNRFVANLLNMTKLESGALEVRTEPVQVSEVIDRVLRRLQRRSGGRKLTQMMLDDGLW
jgi:two-component system sensor histidine kinase KdpD